MLGDVAAGELALGQHGATRAQVLEQCGRVAGLERAHVGAVHGRHRRDVARSQALEGAHVYIGIALGGRGDRVEERVGAAQRA